MTPLQHSTRHGNHCSSVHLHNHQETDMRRAGKIGYEVNLTNQTESDPGHLFRFTNLLQAHFCIGKFLKDINPAKIWQRGATYATREKRYDKKIE
jgi:hypothetical protein